MPSITLNEDLTLPFREHTSAKGNLSFVVAPKARSTGSGFRGFKLSTQDPLPVTATFHGDEDVEMVLEIGVTGSGNPKTSSTATVTVGGKKFTLHVQASQVDAGQWLILKAIPQGSGGGAQAAFTPDDF